MCLNVETLVLLDFVLIIEINVKSYKIGFIFLV